MIEESHPNGRGRVAASRESLPSSEVLRRLRRPSESGSPLEPAVRTLLEDRLHADLDAVRIHADAAAGSLASALDADAFATGADIYFRRDAYNTGTDRGMRLLAHEVAHTLQQATLVDATGAPPIRVSRPGDAHERAADLAADLVLSRGNVRRRGQRLTARRTALSEPLFVQRHASWEHRLLGDAIPGSLDDIAAGRPDRTNLLTILRAYLSMWKYKPEDVTEKQIHAHYPTIQTTVLRGSGQLVTFGEINTLPDYLANPDEIDRLPASIMLPILQAVRQEGYYNANRLLGIDETFVKFEGAIATHLSNGTINDIWESIWLDNLTYQLPPSGARAGTNSYSGLLARNACHFAPYSWYRWGQSYDAAMRFAVQYHRTHNPNDEYHANLHLGYADHFLQDSFAAGHLINKTLVMQWFVEWAANMPLEKVPGWEQLKDMTATRQPGLAARGLYNMDNPGGVRDPQTTEEQATRAQRRAMSGVRADGSTFEQAAYQNYLSFLDSSVVQASPLALHDDLNKLGVWVASVDQAQPYQLFGDGTMLNGGTGVGIACETSHMSQQSIQDVMTNGASKITKQKIQSRFPTLARLPGESDLLPIQTWNDRLKGRANGVFAGVHDIIIGSLKPNMGRMSVDLGATYRIKLTTAGNVVGYMGSYNDHWSSFVKDKASAIPVRFTYDNGVYIRTPDNWVLSVGTNGARKGYVGFYYPANAGTATWEYDANTKRLKSNINGANMVTHNDDGYIYCWSDYGSATVELEDIDS
ncbi:hypothetical protein AYO38_04795 [bacterium SCGC AG-212-C10]|nr:hypothetical protein AYO38_04795 [bacterium SCGC AG-212-C10]